MPDRSTSGLERPRSQTLSPSPQSQHSLLRRLSLISAILLIGTSLWFMLDDGDALGAIESQPAKLSEPPVDVVAQVAGVSITEEEVERSVADELARLEAERQALIESATEVRIRDLLIEIAAIEAGLDREQLLDQEVEARLLEVPAPDVASLATSRGLDPEDADVITELRRELRLERFVDELQQRADVVRFVGTPVGVETPVG